MNYIFTPLCFVRFISGLIALGLVVLLWKRRHAQGAIYLMFFELACAIWAFGDGFGSAGTSLSLKLHWAQISYIGITTCSIMFLLFALSFTNNNRFVNNRTIALLLVIPFLTMVIAFTNPIHKLLWSNIVILENSNQAIFYYGKWFWVNVSYEYTALTIGIIVLLFGAFKVFSGYKIQLWILVTGTLLPFLTSVTYIFKITPFKGIDPTPIAFITSGLVVAFSLYRLRMFNIMPMARKQVIDNLSDGMLVIDSENRVVDANPAFCRLLGKYSKEVIGKHSDFVLSEIGISIDDFSGDNDYVLEFSMGGGAHIKNFEVKCHKVKDKNENLAGRILIFTDITTKKMILDAIAESNNRRRLEIIEKEKLILDLDAYARSVAHDLKNPIGSVVSLSELVKLYLSENKLVEVEEMVGLIQKQSEKMVKIIDDLLILSRIRKEDVKITPIDIKKILIDVLERLNLEISTDNARFEMPEDWPKVLGNGQWIEEVWMNLISNALKYGGVPPVIKIGYEKESDLVYRFWVRDNGDGLSESSLSKIFEDFERLGRNDVEGNGLGLSIVKRIVEKLDGQIKVESACEPGEGCTFSFTLKAVRSQE